MPGASDELRERWGVMPERAWAVYDAEGFGDQTAERVAQRGGFGYKELQCLLAGHYLRCPVDHAPGDGHPPVEGWEAR